MSLGVLVAPTSDPAIAESDDVFEFPEDGSFEALQPFLVRAPSLHGTPIDLYGDAVFGSEHLPGLAALLAEAGAWAQHQPDTFPVFSGTQAHPAVHSSAPLVTRTAVLHVLAELARLAANASRSRHFLLFIGD